MGGRFDVTEVRAGRMPDPQILPGDVVVVGFSRARSLYRDSPPGGEAQQRGAAMTHEWWARLVAAGDRDLAKGKAP